MLRKRTLGLAALVAAFFTLIGAGTASASTVTGTSASTSWGYAEAKTQWRLNPYRLDPVWLYVKDKAPDGHGVAVRLVTDGDAGTVRFQLRRVSTGSGTGLGGGPSSPRRSARFSGISMRRNGGRSGCRFRSSGIATL